MENRELHIISTGGKWLVKDRLSLSVVCYFKYREQAYHKAKLLSNYVVVHNKDGSVLFIDKPLNDE